MPDCKRRTFLERHLPDWAWAGDCADCADAPTRDADDEYEACWVVPQDAATKVAAQRRGEYIQGTGIDLAEAR